MLNAQLRRAAADGLRRGWRGYLWLLKIILPVSAAVALLNYSGWLYRLDAVLEPVLGLIGLSAAAAVPLLVGLFTGIYAAIAAMAALPLTLADKTLVAVFLLISHSLIQEGIVQDRSGLSFWKATLWRLFASIGAVAAVSVFVSAAPAAEGAAAAAVAQESFGDFAAGWALDTAVLAAKMFVILHALMIVLEALKAFGGIEHLVRLASPALKILGLNRRVGVLWLTAAVFGISYGAAVIVEDARNGGFSAQDLEELQVSIGINHAMIEDPVLFMALGVAPVWLWLPRLAAALAAVYLLRGARILHRHFSASAFLPR